MGGKPVHILLSMALPVTNGLYPAAKKPDPHAKSFPDLRDCHLRRLSQKRYPPAAEKAAEIKQQYELLTGKPLFFIGTVRDGEGIYLQQNGKWQMVQQKGYNHFDKQNAGIFSGCSFSAT